MKQSSKGFNVEIETLNMCILQETFAVLRSSDQRRRNLLSPIMMTSLVKLQTPTEVTGTRHIMGLAF